MLELLKFRERPEIFDWAQDGNIILPAKVSAGRAGRLDLTGFEYMREPLEAVRDKKVRQIFLCWAAQTSKTTLCMIALAWWKAFSPSAMLWSLTTKDSARAWVAEKFRNFLAANPWLCRGMKREDFGALGFKFDDCDLSFVGVNVPAELASRPIDLAILDEAGKYEHKNKNEANPADLIRVRMKTRPFHKMIFSSTPSTEEHDFWKRWLLTNQAHYWMPCPCCGQFIKFEFTRETVVWGDAKTEEEVRAQAHYVCDKCGGAIYDTDKKKMISQGEWRDSAPAVATSAKGYHLNALYSNFETFGSVAAEFWLCQKAGTADKLQNFKNSYEAKPWAQVYTKSTLEDVAALRRDCHRRGQIPSHVKYMFIGYDCHLHDQYWVLTAVCAGGELWAVDWGKIPVIEDISEHAASKNVMVGMVDSGWNTEAVYDECIKSDGLLIPSKGNGQKVGTYWESWMKDYGLNLIAYSDFQVKSKLYGEMVHGKGSALVIPSDADDEFMAGLSGQELKAGKYLEWKKVDNDHYGDCLKLAAVSWWMFKREFEEEEQEK